MTLYSSGVEIKQGDGVVVHENGQEVQAIVLQTELIDQGEAEVVGVLLKEPLTAAACYLPSGTRVSFPPEQLEKGTH